MTQKRDYRRSFYIRADARYIVFYANDLRSRQSSFGTLPDAIEYAKEHPELGPDCIWDATAREFVAIWPFGVTA